MRMGCQGRAVLVVVVVAMSMLTPLAYGGVAGATSGGPGAPLRLAVDDLAAPVGIGLTDVYFGWHVGDRRRDAVQSAYRIVVSRPALCGPERGAAPVVWDSGKIVSAGQAFVPYGGRALAPDTTSRWTVQTWDGSGVSGPPARAETSDTGLDDGNWHAGRIKPPTVEELDTPETCNIQKTNGVR